MKAHAAQIRDEASGEPIRVRAIYEVIDWLIGTPIFAPASQPLADWTVSCGKALQVAAVQALCAECWLLVAWILG